MQDKKETVEKFWFAESANIDLEQILGGNLLPRISYCGHILKLKLVSVLSFHNVDGSLIDKYKVQICMGILRVTDFLFCPSSGILKTKTHTHTKRNTTFRKLDIFPSPCQFQFPKVFSLTFFFNYQMIDKVQKTSNPQ
jgi:hypothetical protein